MTDAGTPSTRSTARYGGVARFFHWSVAGLIVVQFVLAELGERAEHDGERVRQLALLANHKSVGMTVLMLAVLRIAWRFIQRPPELPLGMPNWQKIASFCSHWGLYILLFALPITGWLMSSAAAYSVSWFGLFTWPDLVSPSTTLREVMEEIHEVIGKLLFVVAILHILAALKHHMIDKDDVLRRMSSAFSYILFFGLVVVGVWTLVPEQRVRAADTPAGQTSGPTVTEPAETAGNDAADSRAPKWQIDQSESYIEFTAEQAGANFTGRWTQWSADMRFAADALADSRFDVRIEVAGVSTDDADRDSTLKDPEFFDADNHPVVRFVTGPIEATDDGYTSQSTLTIKGQDNPVTFTFDVQADGEQRTLTGSARLDRLALDVGTGEWTDTEWVGQYVDVEVRVAATVAP